MGDVVSFSPSPTFRDPAGSVEIRPDGVYRTVQKECAKDILEFLETPLSAKLVAAGQIVASEILEPHAVGALILRHPRIPFVSYPSEWPRSLWLSAAKLTLDLNAALVREGWILKDATPLNVLFVGTKPVFVDVLSIQRMDLGRPLWFAYGQFIRTFLLPMLADSQLGWPLQVALTKRDGLEPEDLYAALPWFRRMRQPSLTSVTLPVLLSKSVSSGTAKKAAHRPTNPEATKHVILKTVAGLKKNMQRAVPSRRSSTWSEYAETALHYNDADHSEKRRFVAKVLGLCAPRRVLDVGCNAGIYSRLAAEAGAEVVSIDTDLGVLDRLCEELKGSGKNILPLRVDLAHPTPATGWENREHVSFLHRCYGHFDTVLMLAVIHHLLISSQIPMGHIAALCEKIATRNLIIEWVPPTDPKFIEVVRGREAMYTNITEQAFRNAFSGAFDVAQETLLLNGRILFHLTKT
jgi:SAM-dependent methyltransferase